MCIDTVPSFNRMCIVLKAGSLKLLGQVPQLSLINLPMKNYIILIGTRSKPRLIDEADPWFTSHYMPTTSFELKAISRFLDSMTHRDKPELIL